MGGNKMNGRQCTESKKRTQFTNQYANPFGEKEQINWEADLFLPSGKYRRFFIIASH